MGIRVHIVAKNELSLIQEDGMSGFLSKRLYSDRQEDWFNNDEADLAEWFNAYADMKCWLRDESDEWFIPLSTLVGIPEEAYKKPIHGMTEGEMRRFVAECIRCANLTDEECILEWW